MNRKIKFRVWIDTEDEGSQMLKWNRHIKKAFGTFVSRDGNGTARLMQYTGLEDKNGREIYEGDIVEVDTFEPNIEQTVTFKAKIEWLDKAFFVTALNHVDFSGYLGYWIGDDIKVIGNKFENPELLEN